MQYAKVFLAFYFSLLLYACFLSSSCVRQLEDFIFNVNCTILLKSRSWCSFFGYDMTHHTDYICFCSVWFVCLFVCFVCLVCFGFGFFVGFILFCFVLFCFFCFVSFCFVLFDSFRFVSFLSFLFFFLFCFLSYFKHWHFIITKHSTIF